jgi:hypothetical protein
MARFITKSAHGSGAGSESSTHRESLSQNPLPNSAVFLAPVLEPSRYMEEVVRDARNLLGAMKANVEWLRSALDPEAAHAELSDGFDDVEVICERLASLLEDVAVTTRDAGLRMSPTAVVIGSVVRSALKQLTRRAEAAGITLQIVAEGDVTTMADRELLVRALEKLVDYAIEGASPGDRVVLGYGANEQDVVIRVNHHPQKKPLDSEVDAEAKGKASPRQGVPPRHGDSLQADPTMAFCRMVARSHSGTVSICPVPDEAMMYVLTFPRVLPGNTVDLRTFGRGRQRT